MKKLFLLLTVAIAFAAHGAAPAYDAVDAAYDWHYVNNYNPITIADDTIDNSGADTVTIVSNLEIESGWEYILQKGATTGGDADANEINLRLEAVCLDDTGGTIAIVTIDSVYGTTTVQGESFSLDFGGSVFGDKVTLRYRTIVTTGDDSAILVGTHRLIRRRPVTYMRRD